MSTFPTLDRQKRLPHRFRCILFIMILPAWGLVTCWLLIHRGKGKGNFFVPSIPYESQMTCCKKEFFNVTDDCGDRSRGR